MSIYKAFFNSYTFTSKMFYKKIIILNVQSLILAIFLYILYNNLKRSLKTKKKTFSESLR